MEEIKCFSRIYFFQKRASWHYMLRLNVVTLASRCTQIFEKRLAGVKLRPKQR